MFRSKGLNRPVPVVPGVPSDHTQRYTKGAGPFPLVDGGACFRAREREQRERHNLARPVPVFAEQSVPAPGDEVDRALRLVARLLVPGYLRLLAGDGDRRDDHDGRDVAKPLDPCGQQSDELDRQQRVRRPRCKQI